MGLKNWLAYAPYFLPPARRARRPADRPTDQPTDRSTDPNQPDHGPRGQSFSEAKAQYNRNPRTESGDRVKRWQRVAEGRVGSRQASTGAHGNGHGLRPHVCFGGRALAHPKRALTAYLRKPRPRYKESHTASPSGWVTIGRPWDSCARSDEVLLHKPL